MFVITIVSQRAVSKAYLCDVSTKHYIINLLQIPTIWWIVASGLTANERLFSKIQSGFILLVVRCICVRQRG